MKNEFTVIIQKDKDCFVAWCAEVPGANGQGKTKKECLENLSEAIRLILEEYRKNAFQNLSPKIVREKIMLAV